MKEERFEKIVKWKVKDYKLMVLFLMTNFGIFMGTLVNSWGYWFTHLIISLLVLKFMCGVKRKVYWRKIK